MGTRERVRFSDKVFYYVLCCDDEGDGEEEVVEEEVDLFLEFFRIEVFAGFFKFVSVFYKSRRFSLISYRLGFIVVFE